MLEPFLEPNWSQNQSEIDSKFDRNFSRIVDKFLERFASILKCYGYPGSSKMELSCRRGVVSGLIFEWFLMIFGIIFGIIWEQNRIQKSIKKSIRFWIDFWRILDLNIAPFGLNFGSKNRSKIRVEIWRKRSHGKRMFEAWMIRVRRPGRGSGRTHLSQNLDRYKTYIDVR